MLQQGDEGFRYLGENTYSKRDLVRLWGKGKPFHYIEEMVNGSMEEQELVVQVFPQQSKVEFHVKGITKSDESDGNFITHHGITYYTHAAKVSSADQLYKLVEKINAKTIMGRGKTLYWQIVENDGGWM